MKKNSLFLISIFLFTQPALSYAQEEAEMWRNLQNGGFVVLMRHASVNRGKGTGNSLLRDPSCLKERNLSDKGKREAAKIGKTFVAKEIPIEKVLTSPYCRTTETARIAFDNAESVEFLSLLEVLPREQADAHSEILKQRIGSFSGKGNLILITHDPNIRAVAFEAVQMGGFLVLEPRGGVDFEEIGKIKLGE